MSWFSEAFGLKKKSVDAYGGARPISLLSTTEGQKLKGTLEERIAGRNVGFSPDYLSAATTPYAVNRRAGLKEETIPMISAEASARGVGRSTLPVNRIALESRATERDIGEYVGQVSLMNEQQKRTEINNALTQYQQMTGDIVTAENLKAQFDYADYLNQIGQKQAAEEARQSGINKLISLGATVVGGAIGFATGGPAGAMAGANIGGSMFGGQDVSGMEMTDLYMLQSMLGGNASMVQGSGIPIGGGRTTMPQGYQLRVSPGVIPGRG